MVYPEEIKAYKIKYNETLKRWIKYKRFAENTKIEIEEKLKWVKEAQSITEDLSKCLVFFKSNGIDCTDTDFSHGFEL